MKNQLSGRIIKGVGGLYTVRIDDKPIDRDEGLVRCGARGSFRHNNMTPLPGDRVILSYSSDQDSLSSKDSKRSPADTEDKGLVIEEIIDRRNALIRPPMANLDYLFVTMAAAAPSPILSTVDKLISIAEFNGIEPVIVITKSELDQKTADNICSDYTLSGFTCFSLSAKEDIGISPIESFIKENLPNKTAAFAGASGIGKSTLLNRLFPALSLSTSEISRKIERGRHTTRQVELFPIDPSDENTGYIADTPGFSMLDFKRFDFFEKDDLVGTMRDFADYIGECRYTKCTHTKEEGCAILEAIKEGRIPKSRHESYLELYEILKQRKKWEQK